MISSPDLLFSELSEARRAITQQLGKRIIGQTRLIDSLLCAMFAQGHCLFVGVPGLAKTLLISTLAEALDLKFSRIQFTPDLMPSDITGTEVLEEDPISRKRSFRFIDGPIFSNIILADEVNRAPPKTQSALLQSMQERQVSAGGTTHMLKPPFWVFATQNPIEHEGTYPLPEAQLDRFMFELEVDYPSFAEEVSIVHHTTQTIPQTITPVLSAEKILHLQDQVKQVPVAQHIIEYAVRLVQSSRPSMAHEPWVSDFISYGAGPRASQYLIRGAQAKALLEGRLTPSIEDIRTLATPILQHRLIRSFRAEAEGVQAKELIQRLIQTVST